MQILQGNFQKLHYPDKEYNIVSGGECKFRIFLDIYVRDIAEVDGGPYGTFFDRLLPGLLKDHKEILCLEANNYFPGSVKYLV